MSAPAEKVFSDDPRIDSALKRCKELAGEIHSIVHRHNLAMVCSVAHFGEKIPCWGVIGGDSNHCISLLAVLHQRIEQATADVSREDVIRQALIMAGGVQ